MKRGDPDLTFTLRVKHSRDGSESDEPPTPKKIQKRHIFNRSMDGSGTSVSGDGGERSCSSGDEANNGIYPSTPPIFNHHNARRRKGIPHRSPFWGLPATYSMHSLISTLPPSITFSTLPHQSLSTQEAKVISNTEPKHVQSRKEGNKKSQVKVVYICRVKQKSK